MIMSSATVDGLFSRRKLHATCCSPRNAPPGQRGLDQVKTQDYHLYATLESLNLSIAHNMYPIFR
jgi:hypothetical protein